ncbi:MAG: hypothetical protein RIR52_443, partial [Acidobacteriota bacterium]
SSDPEGPLALNLRVRGDLKATGVESGRTVVFGRQEGETRLRYSDLKVVDHSGREVSARFEVKPSGQVTVMVEDRSAVYPLTIDPAINLPTYLKASNTDEASNTSVGDSFGYSVAISGDTVVIGAPYEDSNAKGVNGDQMNDAAPGSGAAYVFVRNGTAWSQQAYLKASNTDSGDRFGFSVAILGDTVVIGAIDEDSNATGVDGDQTNNSGYNSGANSGAVYVFVRNGTAWSQQAYLKASNSGYYRSTGTVPIQSEGFGFSVAISGDTVVVGGPGEASNAKGVNGDQMNVAAFGSGAAYVFVRNGTVWSQQAYLKASNTSELDRFGTSVAISRDTLVVGARGEDSNATGVNGDQMNNAAYDSGAAYVFVRNGTTWSQQAYLKPSNTSYYDSGIPSFPFAELFFYTGGRPGFGISVAISEDTVVVGAPTEDSSATGVNGNQMNDSAANSGAAYVFVRNGATWSQQSYLKASNTDSEDGFGWSVAISGDAVVVGALAEDSKETGINGDQADNSALNSGAAYVFVRNGGRWSQQSYLKASNTGKGDYLGYKVAISGGTIVMGAYQEDSNATGINGDQANNSSSDSGAAYIYSNELVNNITPTITTSSQGVVGPGSVVTITQTFTNNTSLARFVSYVGSLPVGLIGLSCRSPIGTCLIGNGGPIASGGGFDGLNRTSTFSVTSVTSAGQSVSWTGTIPGNSSVTITYLVQISAQATSGAQYCITTAVFGFTGPSSCLTVKAPLSGPGNLPVVAGQPSQQKPGSVLIFNVYTSSVSSTQSETLLSLTNTNPVNPTSVHLFFVDGATCTTADQIITLTQNQTTTFMASDIDPGVTGYLIAIAVDATGCPAVGNYLIGTEAVRFEGGHHAMLAAVGVAGIAIGTPPCEPSAVTTTILFNGSMYDELPRSLAIATLPSLASGNSSLLIINRIGGDLTTGAARLGPLAGLLFDDSEVARSFTIPAGACQLRGLLGNNFPRTVPRYTTVIPAGRTGWMKFWAVEDEAISGVMINEAVSGLSGGYNLQTLTTTSSATLTIPVIPN